MAGVCNKAVLFILLALRVIEYCNADPRCAPVQDGRALLYAAGILRADKEVVLAAARRCRAEWRSAAPPMT